MQWIKEGKDEKKIFALSGLHNIHSTLCSLLSHVSFDNQQTHQYHLFCLWRERVYQEYQNTV